MLPVGGQYQGRSTRSSLKTPLAEVAPGAGIRRSGHARTTPTKSSLEDWSPPSNVLQIKCSIRPRGGGSSLGVSLTAPNSCCLCCQLFPGVPSILPTLDFDDKCTIAADLRRLDPPVGCIGCDFILPSPALDESEIKSFSSLSALESLWIGRQLINSSPMLFSPELTRTFSLLMACASRSGLN